MFENTRLEFILFIPGLKSTILFAFWSCLQLLLLFCRLPSASPLGLLWSFPCPAHTVFWVLSPGLGWFRVPTAYLASLCSFSTALGTSFPPPVVYFLANLLLGRADPAPLPWWPPSLDLRFRTTLCSSLLTTRVHSYLVFDRASFYRTPWGMGLKSSSTCCFPLCTAGLLSGILALWVLSSSCQFLLRLPLLRFPARLLCSSPLVDPLAQ